MPSSDLNLPPMTPAELPSSDGNNPLNSPDKGSGMLSLTDDQLTALGLEDCRPGDTYTIEITKSDSDGVGGNFEIKNVEEGGGDKGDANGAPEAPAEDGEGLPGETPDPDDMGATPPGEANEGSNGADEKVLGVKRRKKEPREGLPDTKNMRNM